MPRTPDAFNLDGLPPQGRPREGMSGRVTLTAKMNGDTVKWPKNWETLCRIRQDAPRTRTLRISMSYATQTPIALYAGDRLQCGLSDTSKMLDDAGVMRITYGQHGARVLYADLAPGDYQLPAFGTVNVDVARYSPSGNSPTDPYDVEGEIAEAAADDFKPFTQTMWCRLDAAATANMYPPQGAYAFDMLAEPGAWTYAGGNGPILETTSGPIYMVRDYEAMKYLGASPAPLTVGAGSVNVPQISVKNQAASQQAYAKFIFYVR